MTDRGTIASRIRDATRSRPEKKSACRTPSKIQRRAARSAIDGHHNRRDRAAGDDESRASDDFCPRDADIARRRTERQCVVANGESVSDGKKLNCSIATAYPGQV